MNKSFDELVRIELDRKEFKRKEIDHFGKERIDILNDNLFNGLEKLRVTTYFQSIKIYYEEKQIFQMDTITLEILKDIAVNAFDRLVIRILDRDNISYDKNENYYQTVIQDNQWLTEQYYDNMAI